MLMGLLNSPERVPQMLMCCESQLCTDRHSVLQLYPVLNDLMQSMNKVRNILHLGGSVTCKDDFQQLRACAVCGFHSRAEAANWLCRLHLCQATSRAR